MSTDTLKLHDAIFISQACKKAIKLIMGDMLMMKEAYLEAKSFRMKSSPDYRYWEGAIHTIEAILGNGQTYMYNDLKEMGMDKKMLYMMYGAQEYAKYYEDVVDGIREPLKFKIEKEDES